MKIICNTCANLVLVCNLNIMLWNIHFEIHLIVQIYMNEMAAIAWCLDLYICMWQNKKKLFLNPRLAKVQ